MVTYRRQGTWALLAALGAGAAAAGGVLLLWGSTSPSVRIVAEIVGHACSRFWGALPAALQLLLVVSLATGGVPLLLWIGAAITQGRGTLRVVEALERQRVPAGPGRRELLDRLGLGSRVSIIRSARPFAMTAGLFRPRIFLSTPLLELLDDDELEAVLLHEGDHLRHLDPLQLLIGRALSTAFFFIPLVGVLVRRHQAAVELAADDYVIARQGGSLGLSAAVCKLLRNRAVVFAPAASTVGGTTDLRLSRLLNRPPALPAVSPRIGLQSAAALVLLAVPAALTEGAAAVLAHAPFLLRCMV